MRAILMFHNCEGQSHKSVSNDPNFQRERRAEADSNRSPSAYHPNALPLGRTGSLTLCRFHSVEFINVHDRHSCVINTNTRQLIDYKRYGGLDGGSSEPVWRSGKALGWLAEGPRFESASALLSLLKGCGLWTVM